MPYSSPGVFNATDITFAGGMSPSRSPSDNASALQAAVDAAQTSANPCGGIVLIPSINQLASSPDAAPYPIGGPPGGSAITIPASSYPSSPLLICGTGNGTQLSMQTAKATSGLTKLFDVSDTENVTFQDLTVSFNPASSQEGVAFSFSGGASHKLFRVEVVNCQYPVWINGANGVAIRHCHLTYGTNFNDKITPINALRITGATHTSIADCVLDYRGNYPTSSFQFEGITIAESSFTTVRETQCYGFNYGVTVGDATEDAPTVGTSFVAVYVEGIATQPGPAITVLPWVFDLNFTDCHCEVPEFG